MSPVAPKKTVKTITAWSFSRWDNYESCPFKAKLTIIDKLKEPDNVYQAHGIDVHTKAEEFLTGKTNRLAPELATFKAEFMALRKQKTLQVEKEMAFSCPPTWTSVEWFDMARAWCRVKIDALYLPTPQKLVVVDHKTGKIREESKEQLGLYALAGFLQFPEVEVVDTKFWYIDHGKEVELTFNSSELPDLKKLWIKRTRAMLNDKIFAPRPGNSCRFCHFRKSNGGPCKF